MKTKDQMILAGVGLGLGFLAYYIYKKQSELASLGSQVSNALSGITSPSLSNVPSNLIGSLQLPSFNLSGLTSQLPSFNISSYLPTTDFTKTLSDYISKITGNSTAGGGASTPFVPTPTIPLTSIPSPLSVAGFNQAQQYYTDLISKLQALPQSAFLGEYPPALAQTMFGNTTINNLRSAGAELKRNVLIGADVFTRDVTLNIGKVGLGVPVTISQSAGSVANAISNALTNVSNTVNSWTSWFR